MSASYKLKSALFFLSFFVTAHFPQETSDPVTDNQSALSKNVVSLSSYIANIPVQPRSESAFNYLDSIYYEALRISNGSVLEALLAATFAVLPYNKVPITFPFLHISTEIPVYSAPEALYQKKNAKIPRVLFFDSPADEFGDSDKPAHFFGSAALRYGTGSYYFCVYSGLFVESFEEIFKADAAVSRRDLQTNELGFQFGKMLCQEDNIAPTTIFVLYNLKQFLWAL